MVITEETNDFSIGAMGSRLGCCIPNPDVPESKSLGDLKVDSAFHLSKIDQIQNRWLVLFKIRIQWKSSENCINLTRESVKLN